MFMQRTFKRFSPYVFVITVIYVYVFDENDANKVSQKNHFKVPSTILGLGTSPKDKKRIEIVEDVIFGQGIMTSHLGGRNKIRQNESNLSLETADVYNLRGKTAKNISPARYSNIINDPSSYERKNKVSETQGKEARLSKDIKPFKRIFSSKGIPDRYQSAIDEYSITDNHSPKHNETKRHIVKSLPYATGNFKKRIPLWMRITDEIHTYSAFWDARKELPEGPVVRILGILKFRKALLYDDSVFKWNGNIKQDLLNCSCLLWYKERKEPHLGLLKAFVFEEGRELFVGTFFLCYPRTEGNAKDFNDVYTHSKTSTLDIVTKNIVPYAVSLFPNDSINAPHKLIYIESNFKTEKDSYKNNSTAVCVRALFGPYNDVRGMIQFITYYTTVLKISHFYFYDLAVDIDVYKLLESLRTVDLSFDILPWNLPTSEWGELWDIGSLTAMNDCVYRSSGRHSHVAIIDLDEFIVPRTPVTGLPDLYTKIVQFRKGRDGDAVLIPNAFFCYDFKTALLERHDNDSFPIFNFVHRESRLWPMKSRSKMVVVPESIVSVGHHMVHNFLLKSLENIGSPKLISVLHHYRKCENLRLGILGTGGKVLDEATMKDASMIKYKRVIMKSKAMMVYKEHFNANR